ncbi:GGDEF domain-containing protein [Hydrocarboniclastica marina]|uniref:Diguanylate cyclase n=1 Tax=Hydrocarboniclastica marina TaxID=2259620 RepID=A0A4P7XGB8_9ALTE|nr:GGDEF domain-containing protein [Hydrocarboniclastica marina]QCF26039.1 diguanylate cyclase [Hydrocarboniclastica marina]
MSLKSGGRPLQNDDAGEILLELVDHLDAMIACWDSQRRCIFANDAYQHWFGIRRTELIGMTMEELLGPLYPQNLPFIDAAYQGQRQVFEREITTPDGQVRHSLATYTPRILGGTVEGIFVHVADVGPLKQLERQLREAKADAERAAHHDFLTGLPNRVLLKDRVNQALALSRRSGQKLALVSADIDGFKHMNDSHGHSIGDQILVKVARRLRDALREADSVTRFGGDEFILLLPGVESLQQVEVMVNRVLEEVRAPVEIGGAFLKPTCSFGIVVYEATPDRPDPEPDVLIAQSDKALYRAKLNGRDRYEIIQPTPIDYERTVLPSPASSRLEL